MALTVALSFFMILVLIICIFGLIGNTLSGIILIQKSFRSSTSYLLFGLTCSDSLLLVLSFIRTLGNLVPMTLYSPEPLNIFIFIWDWICTGGTKYFTVAVSIERYIAICHPFLARRILDERRAMWSALSLTLFITILAIWSCIYNKFLYSYGYEVYVALILHFIPFLSVLIFNVLIFNGVRKFNISRKNLTSKETREISVTRMLLCVVLIFGICYSFEFTRRIMNYTNYFDYSKYEYYSYTINCLAHFFYVLNSSVNFIIYYLMANEFRLEFSKLMGTCSLSKRSPSISQLTHSCEASNDL